MQMALDETGQHPAIANVQNRSTHRRIKILTHRFDPSALHPHIGPWQNRSLCVHGEDCATAQEQTFFGGFNHGLCPSGSDIRIVQVQER